MLFASPGYSYQHINPSVLFWRKLFSQSNIFSSIKLYSSLTQNTFAKLSKIWSIVTFCYYFLKENINTNLPWHIVEICACSVVSDFLQPCGLYNSPGSSAHGIFQAGIQEWVAIFYFKGSSQPRIKPKSPVSPALAGGSFPLSHLESPTMEIHPHKSILRWKQRQLKVHLIHLI